MTDQTTTAAPTWADKIARLRSRPPAEEFITLYDEETRREADAARLRLLEARRKARKEPTSADLSGEELEAHLSDHPDVKAAQEAYEVAEKAAGEAEIVWHFRALPPDVYDSLQLKHEPTREQSDQGMVYNPTTLIPALISACSVNPITVEEITALTQPTTVEVDGEEVVQPPVFNQGEVGMLFAACRNVNERPRMSLGKGSRPTGG